MRTGSIYLTSLKANKGYEQNEIHRIDKTLIIGREFDLD